MASYHMHLQNIFWLVSKLCRSLPHSSSERVQDL